LISVVLKPFPSMIQNQEFAAFSGNSQIIDFLVLWIYGFQSPQLNLSTGLCTGCGCDPVILSK
jgi:hypothetical protein